MPRKRLSLGIDLLRQSMDYDPLTGDFTVSASRAALGGKNGSPAYVRAGRKLGYLGKHGYWVIGFQGVKWLAHVLAWAYVHGEITADDIDHKNRIKTDNRIDNLRKATRGQNMRNCARNDQRGDALGTSKRPEGWAAQVSHDGQTIFLGTFPTQAEAHSAHQSYVDLHSLRA